MKVPGRWYGRGVAEKLIPLQIWLNTVVNIRINRSYVAQLGIFKIRKGAGVTAQMLSRLHANGAIMVNNQDDIEQLVMQEASQASYRDEGVIMDWSRLVTAAFETVTGEKLPAETTATAVSIQSQASQSQFVLIKEGIGMFLERWLTRHAIPIMMKNVTRGDIVRITGEPDELRIFDERVVNSMVFNELDRRVKIGQLFNPEEIPQIQQRMLQEMQDMGDGRYTKLVEDIDFTKYDVAIDITNEKMNKSVLAQNLVTVLQAAPEFRDIILQYLMDTMGLDGNQIRARSRELPQPLPEQGGQSPNKQQPPTPQSVLEKAVTQQR